VATGDLTLDGVRRSPAPPAQDPAPRQRSGGLRRDIQGIRGLGIVFVVVGHLWRWPPGVYAMLDMFFVLSGFLITSVLIDSIKKFGGISFAQFYLSRVRRLMPMAVMVVLVTVAATYGLYSAALGDMVAKDGFWALVFGINWHFAATSTDYFSNSGSSPLLHYWSLSVEEQFYLVWPAVVLIAMLVANRVKLRTQTALVVVLGTITIVSFAYSMWHSVASPGTAYFSTFDRVWEFGVGGLIAVARPTWARMPDWLALSMSRVATIGLIVALFLLTYGRAFPAPWGLPVVLLTGAVMAAGVGRSTRRLWHLDNPPMVYLGDISYSLYLWHLPVNVLLLGFIAHGSPWYYVTAIVVSLALAVASYHLVERPLRHARALMTRRERDYLDDRPPKPGVRRGAVIASTVSLASIGVVLAFSGAFTPAQPSEETYVSPLASATSTASPLTSHEQLLDSALRSTRFPAFSPRLGDLGTDKLFHDLHRSTCLSSTAYQAQRCEAALPTPGRTALLFGDSFADAWSPGVRAAMEPQGFDVQVMSQGECASWTLPSYVWSDGTPNASCAKLHELLLDTVRARPPAMVILASSALQVRNAQRKDLATTPIKVAHDGLARTISLLRSAGVKRIVVLGSPPVLKDLRECVTRLGSPADCVAEPQPSYISDVAGERSAAKEAGVPFIDTESWFCLRGGCPAFVGRTPVTVDGAHLSIQYSRSLAPLLRRALTSG
jgi:peptidoglycan/LPS O-acetylase OafA/YrhL